MRPCNCFLIGFAIGAFGLGNPVHLVGADWPMYRKDAARSGYTAERLADSLKPQWSFQLTHAPLPAWPRSKRMTFDRAPQPIVAEGNVFFGNSVDGKIHALDAVTGEPKWTFVTRAPVRFAPAYSEGRLFVASDDSYLYCLRASNGELLWKKRGGPGDQLILGNGRMVSRWPARGGVVIHDGVVYFAAGIWPTDGVSLYALEPATGKTLWLNDTAGSIYLGQPHGGAFANSGVAAQGYLAATDKQIFMATGRGVPAAFDRSNGEFQYLHLQANTKLGGAALTLSRHVFVNNGAVFDQATGAGRGKLGIGPVVATPDGLVGSFSDKFVSLKWKNENQKPEKGFILRVRGLTEEFAVKQSGGIEAIVAGDKVAIGYTNRVALNRRSNGTQLWEADVSGVVYGLAAADERLFVSTDKGVVYCFGGESKSMQRRVEARPSERVESQPQISIVAEEIIRHSGIEEGYALDFGCGDGTLALELARRTKLFIYGIDPDSENVLKARQRLEAAGLYGSRVMILRADLADSKLPKYFANLIVSSKSLRENLSSAETKEANRLLRPYGGVLVHGPAEKLALVRRGVLEGAGQWTHQYANPANTANSADELVKGPLGMLWFKDLEQQMTQRHGRGHAPLFKNGVLYSEGLDGLIAVDAYNGRKLWEYRLPGILKSFDGDHLMGTSGTGSNYCVSEDSVYVRIGDECLRIDAQSGELVARFKAPSAKGGGRTVWGYIAYERGLLFGTISNPEHVVTYRYRPGGDMKDQLTESTTLFALDAKTGELKWRYDARHSLRHNGVSIGDGWVILIDRPLAEFDKSKTGKPDEEKHPTGELVALDATTGKVAWRNKTDIFGTLTAISTDHGAVMMSYQPTRFRLASEIGGRLAVFNLSDGGLLWKTDSKYDSRPVINDRTIYAQGGAWDLLTGQVRPFNFKRSYGCGVLAGSRNMFVFRSATLGYFDLEKNEKTEDFGGIRPGCWINVIPAGGLVFAPDASAGCSCSYLNQSWIALQPDGVRAPSIKPAGVSSPIPVSVQLTSDVGDGGDIHYTLDGSTPTKESNRYRSPIRLATSAKLRARIYRDDDRLSPVAEAAFLIDKALLPLDSKSWRTVDAPGAKPAGKWAIADGTIRQTSNVMVGGKRVMENSAEVERPGSLFLYRGAPLGDGDLSFEMNSTDDDGVGLAFGHSGPEQYLLWSMHSQRPFRAIAEKQGVDYRVLAENKKGFQPKLWYKVRFEFSKSGVTVFVDGEKDFEIPVAAHRKGTFGFYSWGNSGVQFRNIRFTPTSRP